MRIEKSVRLRGLGIIVLGALLLGLVLACSLFNQTPVARIGANAVSGGSPLAVTFNANNSEDNDGTITAYLWDFGDGETGTGQTAQHTFVTIEPVEMFTVTLTVTDDDGASAQATQTIEVVSDGEPSTGTGVPTARLTANKFIGVDPLTVTFDASGSSAGGGTITAYNWNFGDGGTGTGAKPTHTFTPDPEVTTTFPATVFVWNSNGQVDAAQLDIIVIVPDNEDQDDDPIAEVFVTGPDIIYWFDAQASFPSLFEVKFDPRGSSADAGHSLEYFAWDFGDGSQQVETSDLEITHIYALSAPSRTFVARLTVFDDSGLEHTAIVNITLVNPQDDPDEED
jgi:PKD repeat protein